MKNEREKGKILHKKLNETLTPKHQGEESKFYSRKAKEFKRNWMSPKTEMELDSEDYLTQNQGLEDLEKDLKKHIPHVGSRTLADYLRKFKLNFPVLNHESIRKRIRTHETMKRKAIERAKKVIEEAKENPLITEEKLGELTERALREIFKEYTKEKIRASTPKYPLGSQSTEEKELKKRKARKSKEWLAKYLEKKPKRNSEEECQ